MNNLYTTTLTAKELEIIEKLIIKHGKIVDFNMIYEIFGKHRNKQELKNFISRLIKKGWLIRIKRGVFVISDISARGNTDLSQLTIAQIIDNDSYVSFEAALQYYGLFDQYLKIITSIGKKRTYKKTFSNWTFKYIKSKDGLFYGFNEYNIDGQLIKIASKEKVILDFITYRKSEHNIDLIIEKLNNFKNEFDEDKFYSLSKNHSITTKRILGFVMDRVEMNTEKIYGLVKNNKNYSFMFSGADKFNAKWRIYTNKYFNDKR